MGRCDLNKRNGWWKPRGHQFYPTAMPGAKVGQRSVGTGKRNQVSVVRLKEQGDLSGEEHKHGEPRSSAQCCGVSDVPSTPTGWGACTLRSNAAVCHCWVSSCDDVCPFSNLQGLQHPRQGVPGIRVLSEEAAVKNQLLALNLPVPCDASYFLCQKRPCRVVLPQLSPCRLV